MEELDILKQNWKKNEGSYPKFSQMEIYAMLHKRSSSIVKWILIISILEFVFWVALSFALKDNPNVLKTENLMVDYVTISMSVISYGIIIFFAILFYMNYRKISATDNVKNLMSNILRTRKTVYNYIFVNIAYFVISVIVILVIFINYDAGLISALEQSEANGKKLEFYLLYIGVAVLALGVLSTLFWLFYKLIYGLLLKRLHRNYEELRKLDF